MRQPGCKVDAMPALKGPPGTGKSSGLKALFGAEWFSDAEMDLKSKHSAVKLGGVRLHEFAEPDSIRGSEVER
jgi:putative DNA primase/helicase